MITAIVQARMGSTRLPGKVLSDICGKPMLWHVVNRLNRASSIDQIVVATTTNPADDPLVEFCRNHNMKHFRGSEKDVLDRFYQAAKHFGSESVVRITADCPLIDPGVVDKVIKAFMDGDHDYVTNTLRYTYPDGLDVEIFSFDALERAWREAKMPTEREHVTLFFRTSDTFRVLNVESDLNLPRPYPRWTVDEQADLAFVRAIYGKLGSNGAPFNCETVLRLLDEEPHLGSINGTIVCNKGYYKSLAGEPPIPRRDLDLTQSYKLKSIAEQVIPSCTQTFSKGPTQYVQGVAPVFLKRGQGSHVWDVDGNEYIDYAMALGPIILGHNYPAVSEAVGRQIEDGTAFSLPHPLEVETTELLIDVIPCAEMVRFGKNGSDVTAGAVRLARAYTGKEIIACCGYHGWQDWYIGTTTRNRGVPSAVQKLTIPFQYNDVETLKRVFRDHPGKVAAVIMEPIGVEEPQNDFLRQVSEVTGEEGALLVFDEVITGFRLAMGGAQEYFGVIPDLACFGKAMANGYPISAVTGKREIMELFDEVFFSFTFGGETLSLAATIATIREMGNHKVIEHIWEQGQKLKDGYNILSGEFGVDRFTECVGLAPHTVVTFKDDTGEEYHALKSLFQQECIKRGVLFSGGHNICLSHSNADIDDTLRVYRAGMEVIAVAIKSGDVLQRLEGDPVKAVFRKP